MSKYTKRGHNPYSQYNAAEIKSGNNTYSSAQSPEVPCRGAEKADQPFPNKPVSLRRPKNPETQHSLDLHEFKRLDIATQPRDSRPTQESNLHGRETAEYHHPRKDSQRQPYGELQMSRAIHEKQLALQKKLWRVEEKVRQKIHRASNDAAEVDDYNKAQAGMQKRGEQVRNIQGMQERSTEDAKQHTRKHDRVVERVIQKHEEEKVAWKRSDREDRQLKRNVGDQQISENIEVHGRGIGEVEKDDAVLGQTVGKSMPRQEERDQMTTYNEKKYRHDVSKEKYGSSNKQHKHQARSTTHYQRDEDPKESQLQSVCRQGQADLSLTKSTDVVLQLLPCRICNRKFTSVRLEKHVAICEKIKISRRPVMNSYTYRIKGSDLGEYLKTHSRSRTPEVLKKKKQKTSTVSTRGPQGRSAQTTSMKRFK